MSCGSARRTNYTAKLDFNPAFTGPTNNSGKRKSVRQLLELENDLYEEFGRCSAQLSDVKSNQDDWEWDSFFLMQHHGVPTRLLDWSDGALIALHFAVRDKPIPPKTGSIIYVLDPYLVDCVTWRSIQTAKPPKPDGRNSGRKT